MRGWRPARRWGHGCSELLLHPKPLPARPGVCTAGKTPSADHAEQRAGKSAPGTPAHLATLEGLQACRGPLQMPPRGQALEGQGRQRAVGTKRLTEVTVGSWGACPDPGPGGCLQLRTPCAIRPPGPQEGNHSRPHRYLPPIRGASDRARPGGRHPYRPPAVITLHPAWGSQGPPPCSASTPNGTGRAPGQAGGPGQPPQGASCSHWPLSPLCQNPQCLGLDVFLPTFGWVGREGMPSLKKETEEGDRV